ncbi:MAG: nuclear transport factor 2 family protein [Thiobacillus sp.]|nr:nuclear transport factor 2 family protein [Thiobacillus sp.]
MKRCLFLLGCLTFASLAVAGPLDEKKAAAHLQAVAAGDVEALMRDYAEDVSIEWVGGPLDGRYRGRAAVREVWHKFAAQNDGQPRPARFGKIEQFAHPQGVTLTASAEYGGKTTVRVRHVLVYRDGELTSEVWQIAPALKVDK